MRVHNLLLDRGPSPRKSIEVSLEPKMAISGKFTWELVRGGLVIQRGESSNIITNALLNDIGTGLFTASSMAYCGVGTGNTPPAVTQIDLATPLFRTNRVTTGDGANGNVVGPPFYSYYRKVYLFLEAEANGNLAEMGIFKSATASTMMSRQLFKDAGGTPIVVTKTASDQLRITYEYRVYFPSGDVPLVVSISAVNYNVTKRPSRGNNSYNTNRFLDMGNFAALTMGATETNVLPAETAAAPSGSVSSTGVAAAYTNGNFYRDVSFVWEPAVANFATGIGLLWTNSPFVFFAFTPTKIPKDSTKRLTLNVRHTWGRYP